MKMEPVIAATIGQFGQWLLYTVPTLFPRIVAGDDYWFQFHFIFDGELLF